MEYYSSGHLYNAVCCILYAFVYFQLIQGVLEKHMFSLQAHETWGSSILAMGLWPDSLPSAVFATEDSHLSTVRSDGQILAYCLNRMSMKTSNWTRSVEAPFPFDFLPGIFLGFYFCFLTASGLPHSHSSLFPSLLSQIFLRDAALCHCLGLFGLSFFGADSPASSITGNYCYFSDYLKYENFLQQCFLQH